MATYKSKQVTISHPIEEVYERISNIGAYQQKLDSLPAEVKDKLGDVRFEPDAIVITAAPVGEIRFAVKERIKPSSVKLSAEQSPVPLTLSVNLTPDSDSSTNAVSQIDVEIPAMLKPMVGGKMQEAADKFGELITTFFA
ncbi:hypothetical protein EEL49_05330 [Muribaculaceae bacterium Isolate-104 (HZI)]|jgi:hypothetical protein|nr:hypothetical protein EEL49_05330 [Muribaculaceae bacterium Isolate-104 (HZI)]